MTKFLSTTAVLAALSASTAANAQGMTGDWYGSIFGGYSFGESVIEYGYNSYSIELGFESDSGYILGATVGTSIGNGLRAEAEVSYANYTVGTLNYDFTDVGGPSGSYDVPDGVDIESNATYLMGNIWYDIPDVAAGSGVTPYIGGGLGLAFITVDQNGNEIDSETALAYQVGGGVQMPAGAGMFDIGYRFKATTATDIDVEGGIPPGFVAELSSTSHSIQAGYVMKF